MIHAYAAHQSGGELKPFDYEPGELGSEEVEINVEFCGICHSDLSMLDNEGQMVKYPLVPGHEVLGTIAAVGDRVKRFRIGQKVGLGWYSSSCMTCEWCMSGNHNLCLTAQGTMLGRYGGFAERLAVCASNRVRAHEAWAIPLPESIDPLSAGPLFCGGIAVYNPLVPFDVKPTDRRETTRKLRVGVIGIGGLGHLAVQFLHAWGCDVTVFSGSPVGSPATVGQMLDFAARHTIAPIVEVYSFDRINEAIERLRSGKARYRVVLKH